MIEIQDITKVYRLGSVEVHALNGVSLTIERGEVIAIMGASGSGKSTLMNVLGCLDLPTSGEYSLEGRNIAALSEDELAEVRNQKIGFVFQQFNLLPRISVRRNVELPLLYDGLNGKLSREQVTHRSTAILEKVGLADRVNHKPTELSGGQQQRVAIARALINEPALILADEPTGNLDSYTGAEIMELLLSLNRTQGMTLVLVTHDASLAALAQRTIYLKDGKVL
jgi:putative ABC transport system ATP-binding protein